MRLRRPTTGAIGRIGTAEHVHGGSTRVRANTERNREARSAHVPVNTHAHENHSQVRPEGIEPPTNAV